MADKSVAAPEKQTNKPFKKRELFDSTGAFRNISEFEFWRRKLCKRSWTGGLLEVLQTVQVQIGN